MTSSLRRLRLVRGLALAVLAALPCAAEGAERRPNVVLVVLDDVGVDRLGFYRVPGAPSAACTPTLDHLAAEGVVFANAWTDPVCSPSRAQLLTGRHGFRNGIGRGIEAEHDLGLRVDLEELLPRVLGGYDSSAVGKWHLLCFDNGTENHPLDAGFGYYAGSLFNLATRNARSEPCRTRARGVLGYTNWLKTYDTTGSGTLRSACTQTYATSDTADEGLLRARCMRAPWFLYVAFNAPHWPVREPPRALCPDAASCVQRACGGPRTKDPGVLQSAMLEALDTELGRMLLDIRARDPDTYVFVIGDNGSEDAPEVEPDEKHGKGTLFEGGLHVPLLAVGPGVVRGECAALVSSTDLFATICELAGVDAPSEDSISLVPYLRGAREPLRKSVYAELFDPNQPSAREGRPFAPERYARALRDARFKLVLTHAFENTTEQLFDLQADPREQRDLLAGNAPGAEPALPPEAGASYHALRAELQALGLY
ncbi:MAG: hypothetical protein EXS08_17115 [Planctomycetes bacterium]|nr:hypothetical protein [Planctomycetota bacterium]